MQYENAILKSNINQQMYKCDQCNKSTATAVVVTYTWKLCRECWMADRKILRKLIARLPRTEAIDAPLGFNLVPLQFHGCGLNQFDTFLDPAQGKRWADNIFDFYLLGRGC